MSTPELIREKIQSLREELSRTQVNKATEHHIALVKSRLARLTHELEEKEHARTGGSFGFAVKKTGDATAVLVGFPNAGKSTIINKLTNADSPVGTYEFTTVAVIPGMMDYRGAKIQLLDLPGIIEGAASGRGLGKRVLSVVRSADLVLIVLDVLHLDQIHLIRKELSNMGIRLDERPPNVVVEKTSSGGMIIIPQVPLKRLSEKTVVAVLQSYGILNARVTISEDITDDQLIDVLLGNRSYITSILVVNKVDLASADLVHGIKSKLGGDFVAISAESGMNLNEFKEEIYRKLNFIPIYLRPRDGEPDYDHPLIVKNGSMILDVCNKIHRGLKKEFKHALVWGKSVRFGGQKVGLNHKVANGDVVTIIKQ